MSADLDTLTTRLLVRLGLPSTDGMFPTGTTDQLINDGLKAMATDYDWPWLQVDTTFSTAVGDENYTPPANWTRTLWISDGQNDLELRQRRDLTRWLDTANLGRSRFYAVYGEQIILAPIPNEVRTLRHGYIRSEAVLATGTDVALCPAPYDDLIVHYAMQEAAIFLKDSTMYQMAGQEIAKQKQRISDNIRRSASPVRIKARKDWGL